MNQFQNNAGSIDASFSTEATRKFLLNVYNWMAMGLALTGVIAWGISGSSFAETLFSNSFLFYGIIILQLGVVIGLTFAIKKMSAVVAIGAFFFYSALTGLTMASVFLIYTGSSIASTFFICAAMFGSVSVFGYITKMDLSKFGTFFFMGLIGLVIASVVNMFLNSSTLYWIISYAGVLIFVGLTAYDTQRIKQMSQSMDFDTEEGKKAAVMGSLMLYLDFINMFLFLLRIMGDRK
ncbi:MAG TPA: Bax inhibitor-1/YccA family protein [Ignavibacteria bacterium]|nr:Bax inhibitor-1/YccA family protein [Ignavibacteria bacterium]HQY53445.1 Bax inhibitor-1/YccA family protein [Ignavibacteria bacterium]HRB01514.1 Bax inhibitor-1/YccA family protein [Ignavibacteria bacterium]